MKETYAPQEIPAAIIILDLNTRYYNSIDWMKELKITKPYAKWLVYSVQDNEMLFKALHARGKGYIMDETSPRELKNMLYEIVQGGGLNPHPVTEKVGPVAQQPPKTENRHRLLSGREKEILHFISRGLLYKEIGQRLGIQKETVKKHLAKIYEKLQVQNKIEALNKFYGFFRQG